MIIKSLRHKSPSAKYSVNYVFEGIPKDAENQWVVFQNIAGGYDRKSIISEFNESAKLLPQNLNRSKTYRYHEILAFAHENSPDLSREKLQAITHKYLELRDPDNSSKAICVPHLEKHTHIHILLTSNSLGSNKSGDLRMSNARYYDIRREMERWILREYPELHRSTVYLSKEEIPNLLPDKYLVERRMMELEKPKTTNRNTAKEKISEIIKKALYKSKSIQDFMERINKLEGFQTYSRRGKLTGIIHENKKKYRFTNLGIDLLKENFLVLSRMGELEALKEKDSSKSLER